MLILNDKSETVILESVDSPCVSDHFWVLDMSIMDYTIAPLLFLEEIICPSMMLQIDGFKFALPAEWNILVYDPETLQLDVAEISDLAGKEFCALVYGPNKIGPAPGVIRVVDYFLEHKNIGPSLNKNQMLCHPINPTSWISVSPSDSYNKYLRDSIVSDVIQF